MPNKNGNGPKGHGPKDGHGNGKGPGLKNNHEKGNGQDAGQGAMTGAKNGIKDKPLDDSNIQKRIWRVLANFAVDPDNTAF